MMDLFFSPPQLYRNEIISLYVKSFSEGLNQQFIDHDELNNYVSLIEEKGEILLSSQGVEVTGVLMALPLIYDKLVPASVSGQYQVQKSIYIAELMVDEEFRGKGIGEKLMIFYLNHLAHSAFTDIFIRVWNQNVPALNLYRKLGFMPVAEIIQQKTNVSGNGTFSMQKIYLHKRNEICRNL